MAKYTSDEPESSAEKKKLFVESKMNWESLLGVSLLGAIGSALLYYIYDHLSEDTKHMIRENLVNTIKKQLSKLEK